MTFLSQDNAQYINQLLSDFLKDKHNINIYDGTISEEDYKKMLANVMTFIHQTYNGHKNIQDMNKLTITELKDKLINIYTKAKAELTPEKEFISKLQKLEFNRQIFNDSIPPPNMNDINAADMVYSHPQSTSAPIQMSMLTAPQTVYMSNSVKMGTELNISSWQRDWIHYPNRNNFIWKGPLPYHLDITNVKIGCLVIHKDIAIANPIISIFIEGPNELDVHVSLLIDRVIGNFAVYKPVTESLSLIYLLALPWKISLESGDGEELNLGVDKIAFKIEKTNSTFTTLTLQNSFDFKIGDSIRLYFENTKRILPSTILDIRQNEIDVVGQFQSNGYLLNFSKQFTLILETHSVLQKK